MADPADRDIIELSGQKGQEEAAFNLIVKTYSERLYWHIRKIVLDHNDADDVLQNVYLKVWINLQTFRNDSSLYTWLYRIATNESLSHLRKKKNQSLLSDEKYLEMAGEQLKADPFFNGTEIQLKFQEAILRLPEKQRLVFNMKYFDNMKYEEISEILETSTGALKASYHHAVRKIKIYLEME